MVVFTLFIFLPGPEQQSAGQRTDVATLGAIKKEMGLDKSKSAQLVAYLNDLSPVGIHPNDSFSKAKYTYLSLWKVDDNKQVVALKWPYLRRSYQSNKKVSLILGEALPNTVILALSAFIIAGIFGILFGVIAAIKRHTLTEASLMVFAILGVSAPSFFAAILIAWLFGYAWHAYTGLDMYGSLYQIDAFTGKTLALKNLILPAIALGLRPLSIITQLTRSSMLDVLSQDYIRTATAKGLPYYKVMAKHALRNALNPVLTAVSGWLASLLAGAFFIEYIFNWHGLGKVTVDALTTSDFPVVMGSVLLTALVFVIINIATDVLYALLDPRARNV